MRSNARMTRMEHNVSAACYVMEPAMLQTGM